MRYYFAPLEGITDSIFRRLHSKYFPGIDRYYTPFLSPTVHRGLTAREAREIPAADTLTYEAVPQLLTKVPEDFLWLAGVCAPFPFPVWQAGLGILILIAIYALVRAFSKKKGFFRWLAGVVCAFCAGVFLFTALWGVYHWEQPISQRLGMQLRPYSAAELEETARYFGGLASEWSQKVDRTASGDMRVDFDAFGETAGRAFNPLAEKNSLFAGPDVPVKTLLVDDAFRYMGITGIYVPFTGEASVSKGTYAAAVPHTMCHEAAHRLGIAAEDEANFCAFLACTASGDAAFQYSGWYSAFITCYNALHNVDANAAAAVWESLDANVVNDLRRGNAHYDQYEGKVQEVAEKVNDTYLKAFNEQEGVRSYGQADLYVSWYLSR